jgi:hypothetical protein
MNTIIRLTKFHELNVCHFLTYVGSATENPTLPQTIRVVFRLLFAIPLVILSIDGIRPHHHVNESLYVTLVRSSFPMLIISPLVTVLRPVSSLDILKEENRVLKARPKEFLTMLAGIGLIVSSGITLVVRDLSNFSASTLPHIPHRYSSLAP